MACIIYSVYRLNSIHRRRPHSCSNIVNGHQCLCAPTRPFARCVGFHEKSPTSIANINIISIYFKDTSKFVPSNYSKRIVKLRSNHIYLGSLNVRRNDNSMSSSIPDSRCTAFTCEHAENTSAYAENTCAEFFVCLCVRV